MLLVFGLLSIGLRLSPLSLGWLVEIGILCCLITWKNRALHRSAVILSLIQTNSDAARERVLESFRAWNRGWIRRKSRRMLRDIRAGLHWVDSAERRGVAKSAYDRLALRIIKKYGNDATDGNSVRGASSLQPAIVEAEVDRIVGQLSITSAFALLMPLMLLVRLFILPTLIDILDEFSIPLPYLLQHIVEASLAKELVFWCLMFLISTAPTVVIAFFWIFPQLLQLQVFHWFTRRYYQNLGLIALADSAAREPELISACRAAQELIPRPHDARTYAGIANALESGRSPSDAFDAARIVNKHRQASASAALDEPNPSWILNQLAFERTEKMLRRYGAIVQTWLVAHTLLAGCFIGLIAATMIMTLVTVMNTQL